MKMRGLDIIPFILIVLISVGIGCGDDDDDDSTSSSDDDSDNGDDDADDDADDDSDDDLDDDSGWENLSDELGPGEVRAGIITSDDELIGGPQARGRIGDYKIYNANIEIIVSRPDRPGVSLSTYAGTVIDADRARPADEQGADCLVDLEQVVGLVRGFWAQEIQLIENGRDGQAVIRVIGQDGGIPFVDSFLITPNKPYTIITDYILDPDKDYLTVKTIAVNDSQQERSVVIVDMPFWQGETDIFTPRKGYSAGEPDPLSGVRWVGGVSRFGHPVSYALATIVPERFFYTPYFYSDVMILVDTLLGVQPGEAVQYQRLFLVGDGDTSMFPKTLHAYDGDTNFGVIQGRVNAPEGADLDSVKVLVQDTVRPEGSNYVAMLLPDENGEFSLEAAPGQYILTAIGEGRFNGTPTNHTVISGQKADVEVPVEISGFLEIVIKDESDQAVPCKISLQSGFDADPNTHPTQRLWSISGSEVFRVPPGDYTATASRGYEYEIHQENISIVAGETTHFNGAIERSVDSTGLLCAEFHIHSIYSLDSNVPAQNRIRELAGEGLEIPVMTDHDVQPDFMPFVHELGAQAWVKPFVGSEISPVIGHLGAWPLTPPENADEYYSVPYMDYDETMTARRNLESPEMWDVLSNDYGAKVIQINHPRGDSGCWFTYIGYDPALGVDALDPSEWDPGFHAIEVFNGSENSKGALEDWFSFLDQGLVYTMHGNSDSHSSSSELGSPRNYLSMPTDSPEQADIQDMIDATLSQKSQVSSGPLISFTMGSQDIGGFVSGHGDNNVELHVSVQAPTWIDVNYVRVYSNHGEIIFEDAVAPAAEVVRYDEVIALTVERDAYFVVKAGHSSARLGPVNPGMTIFAITNPIWVDVDGNGVFNQPGLPTLD
jgi:hypothetical protein